MRLRNKKTGEIKDFENLQVYAETENTDESQLLGNFDSFKQIVEYYEDYIPLEPLIKDEKVRKAVRAWAEANSLEVFQYRDADIGARFQGADFEYIQFNPWKADNLEDFREYTISELCGEDDKWD